MSSFQIKKQPPTADRVPRQDSRELWPRRPVSRTEWGAPVGLFNEARRAGVYKVFLACGHTVEREVYLGRPESMRCQACYIAMRRIEGEELPVPNAEYIPEPVIPEDAPLVNIVPAQVTETPVAAAETMKRGRLGTKPPKRSGLRLGGKTLMGTPPGTKSKSTPKRRPMRRRKT